MATLLLTHEQAVAMVNEQCAEIGRLKQENRDLREALDRIRTIDAPVFNGEYVTTINPHQLAKWQIIAEEALAKSGDRHDPI